MICYSTKETITLLKTLMFMVTNLIVCLSSRSESGYPLATGDVCVIAGVTNLDGANGETDTEQTLYISEIHVVCCTKDT